MSESEKTRITGLYGEMYIAMELHQKGWQVYRAYIDEHIDFIIARYYCNSCNKFSNLKMRKGSKSTFPTDRCEHCNKITLEVIVRFLQVKTSEGKLKNKNKPDEKEYSFHAKLRSNVDDRTFYVWIALVQKDEEYTPYFYIFNHRDLSSFDNLNLPTYQMHDNQKVEIKINNDGRVLKKTRKGYNYDWDRFNREFLNNFSALEMQDQLKKGIIK